MFFPPSQLKYCVKKKCLLSSTRRQYFFVHYTCLKRLVRGGFLTKDKILGKITLTPNFIIFQYLFSVTAKEGKRKISIEEGN